jgi:hypothetical protein
MSTISSKFRVQLVLQFVAGESLRSEAKVAAKKGT